MNILKCETCGARESKVTAGRPSYKNLVIFDCGAILIPVGENGEWANLAPCPTPLISALQEIRNCSNTNTCLACQREIDRAFDKYNNGLRKAAAK